MKWLSYLSDIYWIYRISNERKKIGGENKWMKKENIKLAAVLKRELQARGSIASIAREVGISPSLLHDWVSASRNPSGKNLPELRKLARFLGLSLEEILFDESETEKTIISTTTFTDGGKQYRVCIEKIRGR